MSFLPEIGILNPFDTIGDCVLIEPIARQLSARIDADVTVICSYPELFIGHPTVQSLGNNVPAGMRIIDMTDAIRSLDKKANGKSVIIPDKLRRMYETAGLSERDIIAPILHLTDQEMEQGAMLDDAFADKRIGIALGSKHSFKNLPYTKVLIKELAKRGWQVFAFGQAKNGEYGYLDRLPVVKILDEPLRKIMMYLALMDVFVGPDTGLLHIAGALEVPIVVATREIWRDLYECYDDAEILAAKQFGKYSLSTWAVTPKCVLTAVDAQYETPIEQTNIKIPKRKKSGIAIFRLDGMGGTITVADQAKKIYDKYGERSTVVVRGYKDLFENNPHIDEVVEVGNVAWGECLNQIVASYETVIEIRFGIPKVHQHGEKRFPDNLNGFSQYFASYPNGLLPLESERLHHVQLTDKLLGLPYDTIDMDIFASEVCEIELPDRYVLFSNGVDKQHRGMKQTKCWNGWESLIELADIDYVQVGTLHDLYCSGAIDLRGNTSLLQLTTLIKNAAAVVCGEGGMMHLAYACGNTNTLIMRGPTRGALFAYPGQKLVDSYVCEACWGTTEDWYLNCPKGVMSYCMASITPERVAMNLQGVLSV